MVEFARYYINFIRKLFLDIGGFFKTIFEAFTDLLFKNSKENFQLFLDASQNYSVLDWIIGFIVILLNIVFIGFLLLKLFQFLGTYIKFVKTEIEKAELIQEVAVLSKRTKEIIEEKNRILALQVANLGKSAEEIEEQIEQKTADQIIEETIDDDIESRFVKLTKVDLKYNYSVQKVFMQEDDLVSLEGLTTRFINFSAYQLGLYYDKKIISAFFAGLACSKTMILEGISGTGKTSLPYAMGKFFNNDAHIIAVQPSWRDRAEMLGYLNEFTKKFNETDFLKAIYETTYRQDINIVVLDEMNLARVEYYFAEMLSLLEMPDQDKWLVDITTESIEGDPKNLVEGKILLPQNVWFVGTANKDDSTFIITDKVYDRATPIEINTKSSYIDAPKTEGIHMSSEYLEKLFNGAQKDNPLRIETLDKLETLDKFITKNFKVTFGNRIMKQIRTFVPVYIGCGGSEYEALDYMVARKIFRKFEGLNLPFLQTEILELEKLLARLFGKNEFVECHEYLKEIKM
ncbi:MAG: hypothetical protein K8Q99_04560 [Acholeplasmataceae bacterium]|nr:hypothetical protein [Acholeplasmataceae bacterium]